MVNRVQTGVPESHFGPRTRLELPVECVAVDAKLSGQLRLWLPLLFVSALLSRLCTGSSSAFIPNLRKASG